MFGAFIAAKITVSGRGLSTYSNLGLVLDFPSGPAYFLKLRCTEYTALGQKV